MDVLKGVDPLKIGVYLHDGFTFEPRAECPYYWGTAEYEPFLDWLRHAGVERVEYCQQMGWYRYPTLPEELDRLRARQRLVEAAHRRGMEFSLITGLQPLLAAAAGARAPWAIGGERRRDQRMSPGAGRLCAHFGHRPLLCALLSRGGRL